MRRLLLGAALAAAAVAGAMALWILAAPSDPQVWHRDPMAASGPLPGSAWRVAPEGAAARNAPAPVFPVEAHRLAAELDAVALSEPRTRRLAGDPDELWTTYIQRSRVMRFPDYVSVRLIELGAEGSTLAIESRARFGVSDMGVNRARVERWLAALEARLG